MRQIHPVGFHEKFVASGIYTEYQQDVPTGKVERWSIHELPDGAQLIRVDYDWSKYSSVLIEAWRSPASRVERIDIHFWGAEKNGGIRGEATYLFEADTVQVGYTIDGKPRQQEEVALPSKYVPSVHSTLFFGFTIADVSVANGDCIPVCMCTYPKTASDPEVQEWGAVALEEGEFAIAGKSVAARRYQWNRQCDADDNVADVHTYFLLDEHHTLLQTENVGNDSIRLTQYARKPS
jgi:hypothetical protein